MGKLIAAVVDSFREKYSSEPDVIIQAPGRVNIIGEHTDYTGGFVLPVAIDKTIVIAAGLPGNSIISGYSVDFKEDASCKIGNYDPDHPAGWFRYVMGVLSELERSGKSIEGFNFTVGGSIPIGSGLSSSAALETAVITAVEGLFNFSLDDIEAALLCQRAENNFVGMNCGIMDQFISRMGRKDHALLIDCTDLSYRTVELNLPGYSWIVIDSQKRRGLVDSEYNKRRTECEEALDVARSLFPGRKMVNLRDVSMDDLPVCKDALSDTVFSRLKHVVTENNRVLETVKAFENGDISSVGTLLYQSHASLRDDFEVSCEELDSLVEILSGVSGIAGVRLTGAGFGGCVIALANTASIPALTSAVAEHYHPGSLPDGIQAEIWPVTVSDGAKIL